MKNSLVAVTCVVFASSLVGVLAFARSSYTSFDGQTLAPFKFAPEAAVRTETAAETMFLGIATASPRDFGRHLLLGVCNNEVDVLQRFAESLHVTQFIHEDASFNYYDLRDQRDDAGKLRLIHREKPIHVIASAPFDSTDPRVKALAIEAASTYAGDRFLSIDVAGKGSNDDIEYRTRVVVVQVGSGWYGMPRCRSSKNFYAIADAMQLMPATDSSRAN